MQIRKVLIVISSLVDSTVKEYQPDVEFLLFQTIKELGDYIQTTPIRADTLYMTKDALPASYVNSNLTYLLGLLDNPFLGVNKVVYVTEKNSEELVSIKYLIESSKSSVDWKIIEGSLTRDYISSLVNGTLGDDEYVPQRKVVYRMPKEAYYRERREEKKSLDDKYISDEDYYSDIPDVETIYELPPDRDVPCEIKHIVGIDSYERTAFTFLVAQYYSLSGKTLIIEKDADYHTLTEFVTKSNVSALILLIEDFMENPIEIIEEIKSSDKSLICMCAIERVQFNYVFLLNTLVNNLMEDINYFIEEDTFNDVPDDIHYTIVVPANMLGLLQTIECIDRNYLGKANFVGVNLNALPEISIKNSEAFTKVLRDVLDNSYIDATVVNITSLHLKGDSYDLNSIL